MYCNILVVEVFGELCVFDRVKLADAGNIPCSILDLVITPFT